MGHVSLYRKYRSQSFDDLIGQGHVVRTLQNSLASGKTTHAYLFTGPRGTGKTSTARLLAKALNCEQGPTPEPCNQCAACTSITDGSCFDVFEVDAASESGVEDVREKIVAATEYPPGFCRYKIFILDEVHDLSAKAFDALLKTIEEPPSYMVFILATTEYQKVPPTIRSRCQKYEFHRGSVQDVSKRLEYVAEQEDVPIHKDAIRAIARMADGGYRDALNLLEQAMITREGPITLEQVYDQLGLLPDDMADRILIGLHESDIQAVLETLEEVTRLGRDPRAVLESLLYRLAELHRSVFGLDKGEEGAINATLHATAARIGSTNLLKLRSELATSHTEIRDVTLPRIWLESELVRVSFSLSAPAPEPKPAGSAKNGESSRTVEPASKPKPVASPRPTEIEKPPIESSIVPADPPKAEADAALQAEESAPGADAPKAVVSAPLSTGDPEIDRAAATWLATVKAVGHRSKTLGAKLESTSVKKFVDGRLTIGFERKIDLDSVVNGKYGDQKRGMILEELAIAAGAPWKVEYVVDTSASADDEPTAVELPAEGQRLQELAREIFPGA